MVGNAGAGSGNTTDELLKIGAEWGTMLHYVDPLSALGIALTTAGLPQLHRLLADRKFRSAVQDELERQGNPEVDLKSVTHKLEVRTTKLVSDPVTAWDDSMNDDEAAAVATAIVKVAVTTSEPTQAVLLAHAVAADEALLSLLNVGLDLHTRVDEMMAAIESRDTTLPTPTADDCFLGGSGLGHKAALVPIGSTELDAQLREYLGFLAIAIPCDPSLAALLEATGKLLDAADPPFSDVELWLRAMDATGQAVRRHVDDTRAKWFALGELLFATAIQRLMDSGEASVGARLTVESLARSLKLPRQARRQLESWTTTCFADAPAKSGASVFQETQEVAQVLWGIALGT